MGDFIKVGRASEFREGRGRAVDLQGTRVAIFKVGQRYFALQDACPHMGLSLADGTLTGDRVTCHGHGWRFDLRTGQSHQRSGACAKVYEVRVQNDDLLVERPDPEECDDSRTEEEPLIRWDPDRFFKDPGQET